MRGGGRRGLKKMPYAHTHAGVALIWMNAVLGSGKRQKKDY